MQRTGKATPAVGYDLVVMIVMIVRDGADQSIQNLEAFFEFTLRP
jgi:hypothetical protein